MIKKVLFIIYSLFLSFGCFSNEEITYYKHIYPIIQNKCNSCHHVNGYATLVFDSYTAVKNNARTIQYVIENNIMPPWKADTAFSHFSNERYLTNSEKTLINQWIKNKCKEGKLSDKKYSNEFKYTGKSRINRKPNMVLSFPEKYIIKNDTKDRFVYIKIPYELENDTMLDAIEFIPDNIKYLHHLNFKIFNADSLPNIYKGKNILEMDREIIAGKKKSELYNELGLLTYNKTIPTTEYYGSWVPGMSAINLTNLPLSIKLPKKGVIFISILHYAPSSEISSDSSSFYFYFKNKIDTIENRKIESIAPGVDLDDKINTLTPFLLLIKPNTTPWFHYKYKLDRDFTVLNLNPHMHLLGKKFIAYAIYEQDTIPLVKIDNWDFDWQELYTFSKPLILKKGTIICMDGYYDNTVNNPKNPFHPPRFISGDDGMNTTSEMFKMIMMGVSYKEGDEYLQLTK